MTRDNAVMMDDEFNPRDQADREWAGLIERHDTALAALKEPRPDQDFQTLYDEWEAATKAIGDHVRRIRGVSDS
jgi:hypothetical protein